MVEWPTRLGGPLACEPRYSESTKLIHMVFCLTFTRYNLLPLEVDKPTCATSLDPASNERQIIHPSEDEFAQAADRRATL